MDLKQIDAAIQKFIRPNTFPLGIKFCKSSDAIPHRTKFPLKDLGIQIMPCQAFSMARRYGWTMGLTKDDIKCGTGMVVLGFVQAPPEYFNGEFSLTPSTQTPEIRSVRLKAMDRLPLNEDGYVVISPIFREAFEPDLYLIYGNPAQILRFVQASAFKEGGYQQFKSAGGASCSETLATPMVHDQCQLILPGNGERIFGHTEDYEISFAIPKSKIEDTIAGFQLTKEGGQVYPIPYYLRYEPEIPERYMKLTRRLRGQ